MTQELPTLNRDPAFWGMTATQFLGAFNDNLFKQLMLLLALKAGGRDLQGPAMIVFAAPFIFFSGFAGYLSDRYSKRPIIIACKVAEIGIMLLGLLAFYYYEVSGLVGLMVVLLLMGVHSTFFGPGKYGILPEMLRERDLPRANGWMVMTTFLAIIFGTASAGLLTDPFAAPGAQIGDVAPHLWRGSAVCICIAIVGTLTSLLVRYTPAACPQAKFSWSTTFIPPDTRRLLAVDRELLLALLASCVFWMVAGLTQQTVNSLGKVQLGLSDTATSIMAATIGIGIAVGAVAGGKLSGGRVDFRVAKIGAWGSCLFLLLLGLPTFWPRELLGFYPGEEHGHLLGFAGSLPALALMGVAAGFFAIPVQTFIQSRPPKEQKGRIIGVQNTLNFAAILLSGVIYIGFDQLVTALAWPRATIFLFTAALMLPVAIFYRPKA